MDLLQMISIALEVVIATFGIRLATVKGKSHGWCLALTFGIYVFYDLSRFFDSGIGDNILSVLFFIATISILWFVWRVYKELS